MSLNQNTSAEQSFRDAFERIKQNKTKLIPKGSLLTQNNVAREAGRDPSALRKSRYPFLILDIQSFLSTLKEENQSKKHKKDNRNKRLHERIKDHQNQIDKLCSIVAAQNNVIKELKLEISRLESEKLVSIKNLIR